MLRTRTFVTAAKASASVISAKAGIQFDLRNDKVLDPGLRRDDEVMQ